ncbi:radical SAM/SPASM domain-containing protein [Carboxylicivirga sp. N1Y90]|uniref:radical SAM/SPASM domain-containing protein n=1 Tax=Carboxylicivirga fragile TaxID=3417571 RepID=UPI003D33ECFA
MAVSIEPTSICNLKCPECPTGAGVLNRPRGQMELKQYEVLLGQLGPQLMYLNLYVQGEPMMHPQFAEMVLLARKQGYYTSCSTNGHFLSSGVAEKLVEADMTRLIFSVDGLTQDSYQKYRVGGDLSKVIDSIKNVVEAKRRKKRRFPIVVMQFLVFEHNEHELDGIRQLAKSLDVDKLELKSAQFNSFAQGGVKPPVNNSLNRYVEGQSKVVKGSLRNHCWRQWHSAVITWNGALSPCCFDKDATHAFGNVFDTDFQTLNKSEISFDFKDLIINDKKAIAMCLNCTEGRSFLP